jgi:hypothetical protein
MLIWEGKGVNDMYAINATQVRNDWSSVSESVIREKPAFIKKTRDYMFLSNINTLEHLLSAYEFTADMFIEDDDSVTLSLSVIDLVENGADEQNVKFKMAQAIIEYAEEFYNEYDYWASAPNRKDHIPYVLKALIIDDPLKLKELIQCHHGKS